jgi:6,7-dimethyl-8-ribityllumazine synthase
MRQINGDCLPFDGKIAIVASRFNDFIVEQLVKGASSACLRQGLTESQIEIISVPGAFELPYACKQVAKTGRFKGIIALGAVIRGGTPHFEYVAGECAKGIAKVSIEMDIPISFGVLTCDTIEQAIERAGTKAGNKGIDAALAAIELINLTAKIHD